MISRALLALTLALPLSGCFFSLDGSLVDRKRDAAPRELSADRSGKDGGQEGTADRGASEGGADLPAVSDAVAPEPEQKPGG